MNRTSNTYRQLLGSCTSSNTGFSLGPHPYRTSVSLGFPCTAVPYPAHPGANSHVSPPPQASHTYFASDAAAAGIPDGRGRSVRSVIPSKYPSANASPLPLPPFVPFCNGSNFSGPFPSSQTQSLPSTNSVFPNTSTTGAGNNWASAVCTT